LALQSIERAGENLTSQSLKQFEMACAPYRRSVMRVRLTVPFAIALTAAAAVIINASASSLLHAEPLSLAPADHALHTPFDHVLREPHEAGDDADVNVGDAGSSLAPELRRLVVEYPSREAPGTIIIDTPNTRLYYVLGGGRAIRYGIGVGREGFTWSGVETVSRTAEWPDWSPPPEMISRQPYLPRFMAGGPGNPLGARALYLGSTAYRVHGTNDPSSIGHRVSSGCIRLTNEDIIDLYGRVKLGAKVIVLPASARSTRTAAVRTRLPTSSGGSVEARLPQGLR
jgi:lipoprotein-anchoring transpeptidase ErfK/SrfK